MTTTSPVEPQGDPTLAALVPTTSRGRTATVAALAVGALVLAGWFGTSARLNARVHSEGADLLGDGRVAIVADLAAPRFPRAQLVDVTPARGTTLDSVWVLTGNDPHPLDGARVDQTVAALEGQHDRPTALPQVLTSGEARVLILLDVTDCAQVEAADAGPLDPVDGAPSLRLRSVLGTSQDVALSWFGWPRADLVAAGACR